MIRFNEEWDDYKVLRTGDGYKLEEYSGGLRFLRPDPQVIWKATPGFSLRLDADAVYSRNNEGLGSWALNKSIPSEFFVNWRNLRFSLKLMDFKHTGVFPEQAYNWAKIIDLINQSKEKIKVLNLFAYTGGATLAALSAGAEVTHVDAAKSMCERAKRNIELSYLPTSSVRFIVDDCLKFVEREIKRGKKYDAIIMDPPSYGRGPNGEIWRIGEQIYTLVEKTKILLCESPLFYLINSYTTGLQPTAMANILEKLFSESSHTIESYEIGINTNEKGVVLPCGASALMVFK